MSHDEHELPERVGPYRVLQLLGQGGMGAVYEGEETGPVRRRVAIKLVRREIRSQDVIARFEAERQALALMNHPGIARVLSAGTTEAGEPYFSMELVRGLPITDYCDAHRLPVARRISLFIDVCRAVQHAHQKGVIHRDLKPSNVLIAEVDGQPQPKIIDFGVAKALGPQFTNEAVVTLAGLALGTAVYMSPEQADSGGVDIDTRADVYSLGVMLYEILAGTRPLEPGQQGMHAFLALLAAGRLTATPPSTKVSEGPNSGALAAARATDPLRLRRELRGDLDWIVLKAMNAERGQRYETANAFADDLQRYLENEPVVARPPSAGYRIGKFVRRHRLGAATTAVAALAVIGGALIATVGFVRARREAAAANAATRFLVDMFNTSNPAQARGTMPTAREILDRGAERVRTDLKDEPLLEARLLHTLGTVYHTLGVDESARSLLSDAARIREQQLGPRDPLLGETLRTLGDVARAIGDLTFADSLYRRAVAIHVSAYGREHPEVSLSLATLASLRYLQQRRAEAESLYTRVLAMDARFLGADDPVRVLHERDMAVVYYALRRYEDAEGMFRKVLATQERTLPPDHPDLGATLNNLGTLNFALERYDVALGYYMRVLPIYQKTLGEDHIRTAGLYNNLGEARWKLRNYDEAEQLLRRALAGREKLLKPGAPTLATTLHALAGVLRDKGRYREAEPYYKRALDIREKVGGTDHTDLVDTMRSYAAMLRQMGRGAEAAKLEERAGQLAGAR